MVVLPMEPDRHRAFVREIDRAFGQTYGYGGMGVLVGLSAWGWVVWEMAWYTHVWAYVVGFTLALIGLRVVSSVVKRTRPRLRRRVDAYCEANGVESQQLREFFEAEKMYPYFLAVFEVPPKAESKRS